MDEQDKILEITVPTVQLLEISPVPDGMSFGALLEKFYLKTEAADNSPEALSKDAAVAQDFVKGARGVKEKKA